MARHSKRHNIKHRKAAQDAKKSKIYARIGKIIQMAAKGGADPLLNPSLATALLKAKEYSLPKDVVTRAIEKGSGGGGGEQLAEVYYEGYGPAGSACFVKTITDNVQRTGANMRAIFARYGGNLAEPGAVKRQFEEKGELYVSEQVATVQEKGNTKEIVMPVIIDRLEGVLLETDAENYEVDEDSVRIITRRDDFLTVRSFLVSHGYRMAEADLQFLPTSTIELDDATYEKFQRLVETLEDDDDVDMVWHNVA